MARRRAPNVRDRLPQFDRSKLLVGVAAVILVAVIVMPRVYPAARLGPECSSLAHPIGGNNRSLLAQAGDDQQALELDIALADQTTTINQPLEVRVTFINQDIGPIILYLSPQDPPLIPDANGIGLFFEISQIGTANQLIESVPPPQPPASFNYDDLHLLGSRSRCHETFILSAARLQSLGLQPGEYRMRAYYRNTSEGQLPLPDPALGMPTATPMYQFQGVWTGRTSSNEVIFTVLSANTVQ